MAVTLQACFEIDLPTSTLETIKRAVNPAKNGIYKVHTSAKAFTQLHPCLLPHLVRNGWLADGGDLLLIVTPDEEENGPQVDQPVA